jgi:hypothetical protein
MSALRDALVQYVALRRGLGTQLQEPAMTLVHFLEFLEERERSSSLQNLPSVARNRHPAR